MRLIFLLIFCFSQFAFSCPQAFVDSSKTKQSRTSIRVTLSTPKEKLMLFSKKDVQDLNSTEVSNLLFSKNVPIRLIGFLKGAQVNGLISKSQKLRDPENNNIFYLLVRMHIHLISSRNIPKIPETIIKELLVYDIKRLSPQQIYALTRDQIAVLSKEQIQAFTPEQIAFFKEKIEYFLPHQLEHFLPEQINAILPSHAEFLKPDQRRSLIRLVR